LPPTTTTTTTLTPNPKIFIGVTQSGFSNDTNTNGSYVDGYNVEIYWTTDPAKTQNYVDGGAGPPLLYNTTLNATWIFFGPLTGDISSLLNVGGISPGVITPSTQYPFNLTAGQNRGYIHFYIYNATASPYDLRVVVDNAPDTSQLIGTPSDATDPQYVTRATAGTSDGYGIMQPLAIDAYHEVTP